MLEIDGSRYTGNLKCATVGDRIETPDGWETVRPKGIHLPLRRRPTVVSSSALTGGWEVGGGAGWHASFDPGSQFDKLVTGHALVLMNRRGCCLRPSAASVDCGGPVCRR